MLQCAALISCFGFYVTFLFLLDPLRQCHNLRGRPPGLHPHLQNALRQDTGDAPGGFYTGSHIIYYEKIFKRNLNFPLQLAASVAVASTLLNVFLFTQRKKFDKKRKEVEMKELKA